MNQAALTDFWQRYRWPIIVAAITLATRAIYLIELSRQPGFSVPMVDERWHWEWAHDIIAGPLWGTGSYFRAPLYPYFLALLAEITGSSIFWCKLLQSIVAAGTAVFVFKLARHLFGQTAAIAAGIAYALYGTLVFYETAFLIPVLFLFFMVWAMYRAVVYRDSHSVRSWLLTGIIFGLAAISRPNILLVIPFLMVWLFASLKQPVSFLKRVALPAAMAVGTILMILPVTIRNVAVTGEFILISSQGGINLYLGNNEVADGLTMLMPEVDLDESVSWRQFIPVTTAAAREEAGRELSDAEVSAFWTDKALDFITSHPGEFLTLILRKSLYLLSGFENSDNLDLYHQRTRSLLYAVLLWDAGVYFPFGLLLPLTLMGVWVHRDRFRTLLPVYIFAVAYVPSIVLFLVTARHRLPLIPFAIVIAAAGVVSLVKNRRQLRVRRWVIAIGIGLVSLLLFNRTFYDAGSGSAFQVHFNNGLQFARSQSWAEAEREYLLAHREYPYSAPLMNNLGYAQLMLNKLDSAAASFESAIRRKPDFALPYNNLGLVLTAKGDVDSAKTLFRKAIRASKSGPLELEDLAQMHLNIADAFEQAGQTDSAEVAYLAAIDAAPMLGEAYFRTAAFYARVGRYLLTDSLYGQGMWHHDLGADDYFNWGLSFMERQRYSEGVAYMIRALNRDPRMHQAHYAIAVGFYNAAMPSDSVWKYLDMCLRHQPDYAPALRLKDAMGER